MSTLFSFRNVERITDLVAQRIGANCAGRKPVGAHGTLEAKATLNGGQSGGTGGLAHRPRHGHMGHCGAKHRW